MGSYRDRGEIEPSEAELLQDLAYDDIEYCKFCEDVGKSDVWVSRDRSSTPINRLTTSHLKNIIAGIDNGKSFFGQWWKLDQLERELQRRER